jgi:hypothetical protein
MNGSLGRWAALGLVTVGLVAACGNSGNEDNGSDASNEAAGDVSRDTSTYDATTDAGNPVTKDAAPDVSAESASDSAPDAVADSAPEAAKEAAAEASMDAPKDSPIEVSTVDAGGCSSSTDCMSTQYCNKTLGNCDGKGVCTPIPSFCPTFCSYVCGCDKVTYCNSCYAAQMDRTTIASTGACM